MSEIITPSILSGFMELLPDEQVLFDEIKAKIEAGFRRYGFWPIDTPAIEKCEILFAKGGGETSKQIYRIDKGESSQEQALRFDLTVPLARYVAQHASELSFPFRRYHIAKVYRGERSQKGRYREFYQCDIDIIGRESLALSNDAEIPAVIYSIFRDIGVGSIVFHINNRRLMNGFFRAVGITQSDAAFRAVDKLAKIGEDSVRRLLVEEGLDDAQIDALFEFIAPNGDNDAILSRLEGFAQAHAEADIALFNEGLDELTRVYALMQRFGIPQAAIAIDLSITRGLDYYTGSVFETFLTGFEGIGSICSGGRYDDLATNFSKTGFPGIGLSIGLTRLFYQLSAAKVISPKKGDYVKACVLPMSDEDMDYAIDAVSALRDAGVISVIYMEPGKVKKKFAYADSIGAHFALIIGERERMAGMVSFKDLATGEQENLSLEDAIARLNA